jgi:hypothetical protein
LIGAGLAGLAAPGFAAFAGAAAFLPAAPAASPCDVHELVSACAEDASSAKVPMRTKIERIA